MDWLSKNIAIMSAELANMTQTLMRKYEKNGDISLIGHSLGGRIALGSVSLATSQKVRMLLQLASPNSG